ncbi:hypothetical protein D3C76_1119100 [compost metagenome]
MASDYGYDEDKINTSLISGKQWDTVMKWISYTKSYEDIIDSRSFGNNIDSYALANIKEHGILQVSGYSDMWKINNIYDLSGNLWEWTMEKYLQFIVYRGGFYQGSGVEFPVSFRQYSKDGSYVNVGFRVILNVL